MYANGTKGLGEYRQEKESSYLVLMSSSDKALKKHSTSEQAMDGICKFDSCNLPQFACASQNVNVLLYSV